MVLRKECICMPTCISYDGSSRQRLEKIWTNHKVSSTWSIKHVDETPCHLSVRRNQNHKSNTRMLKKKARTNCC